MIRIAALELTLAAAPAVYAPEISFQYLSDSLYHLHYAGLQYSSDVFPAHHRATKRFRTDSIPVTDITQTATHPRLFHRRTGAIRRPIRYAISSPAFPPTAIPSNVPHEFVFVSLGGELKQKHPSSSSRPCTHALPCQLRGILRFSLLSLTIAPRSIGTCTHLRRFLDALRGLRRQSNSSIHQKQADVDADSASDAIMYIYA